MNIVEEYLAAVAMRKAQVPGTTIVNVGNLIQLEGDDLPRHQEMIRAMHKQLMLIADMEPYDVSDNEDLCKELIASVISVLERVELIAFEGSKNNWGDCTLDTDPVN